MSATFPVSSTRRAWAAFARHLAPRRRGAWAGAAALLVASALAIVPPFLVGALIDAARDGEGRGTAVRLGVAIALVSVAAALLQLVGQRLVVGAAERAVGDLRAEVVEHALQLDGVVVERHDPGDLVSRVADDGRLVATSVVEVVPGVLAAATAIVVTLPGLFAVDWRLGLVGLLAVPLYAHTLRWYLPASSPLYAAQRAALGRHASRLLEAVQSQRTIRAFGRWEETREDLREASRRSRDHADASYRVLTRMFARNNRAEYVIIAAILLVGFLLVDADAVTIGGVATAALLYHRLFNPLNTLVGSFDEVLEASAALNRLTGVLEEPRSPRDLRRPERVDALVAAGVTHRYGDDGPLALDGVDLSVGAGETVALVGASGAGKSTLAAALAGSLVPTGGHVAIGGLDARRIVERELRRVVCLVAQEAHVFAGTVAFNLRLANDDADDAALWRALDDAGAAGWVRALPEGLETEVGDDGLRLGPQEAQQLALARVVLADPAFVVLDEAAAEDGAGDARVLERAAERVVAGRGALVVAHRLRQVADADRIVVMERGRIVEQGTHDALLDGGGPYAALWRAWSVDGDGSAPTGQRP